MREAPLDPLERADQKRMPDRRRLIKNAAANLTRGGAIGMVTVLLPPFLVRHMQPAVYSVWILILQTAAYAGFLDFGLQIAVGRYIAYAEELKDTHQRDTIFSTASLGLFAAAVLNSLALVAVIAWVRHIFPAVPTALVAQMRWALLIVGLSVAAGLPASAWSGVFVGLQRNEVPAGVTVAARLLMVAGLIAAVYARTSLVTLALIVAFSNLASYGILYTFMRKLAPALRFRLTKVSASAGKELAGYCAALTLMSFCMLLINGFDLILVGRFDFRSVIPYSVASGIIPLIAGSLYAVMNAMMPQAAALHAQGKAAELGQTVISATRISVLLLVLGGAPLLVYAGPLLKLWIGAKYGIEGRGILAVLLVANMIRLVGAAYSIVLVSAGQQRLIKISPMTEALTNFIASVALGAWIGGIGVAWGTLIGAVVSIGSHLVYSMPKTLPVIRFSRREYLLSGVGLPLLCNSPLLLVAALALLGRTIGPVSFVAAALLSLGASLLALSHYHDSSGRLLVALRGWKTRFS